ncbi:glycerol-3-phosphate 1-O-acyltransferase PlsY [Thermocrinis jamiesonii]|jgi:acyl-phosphate glycerol-3-phosphate acyltransferase|uniref:glycerol-3-phosphate 1-O-acyltransferase PlsY n=1 Tax=Thermocrinis jamiesonii TaxID=1302351 RepID=UPI0004959067|nr:glycerol-3-phosphate 1-O-acyltransferase PlsY [Thermocrinis jamiesonii]
MDNILLILFAYLLGSVLFGELLAKSKGIDLRSVGSGNVGATNVSRALGKKYGVLVFFLDFSKGLFPVVLSRIYFGDESWTTVFVGIAAFLGHLYPFFHNFRGGKGVATAFGVLVGVSPTIAILSFLVWLLIFKLKGYVSLASLGASLFALVLSIFTLSQKLILMFLFITLLIIYRHKDNIRRLLEGTELGFKR